MAVLFVGAEGHLLQLLTQVPLGPIVTGTVARRSRGGGDESAAVVQFHVRCALLPVKPIADDPTATDRPPPSRGRTSSSENFGTIENYGYIHVLHLKLHLVYEMTS